MHRRAARRRGFRTSLDPLLTIEEPALEEEDETPSSNYDVRSIQYRSHPVTLLMIINLALLTALMVAGHHRQLHVTSLLPITILPEKLKSLWRDPFKWTAAVGRFFERTPWAGNDQGEFPSHRHHPPQQQHRRSPQKEQPAVAQKAKLHVVFSTGCSPSQNWQSFLFFHQAKVIRQPGNITRIASGCTPNEEAQVRQEFDDLIRSMRPDDFHIHFTPDYTLPSNSPKPFHYSNKPFGLRHWMQNVMKFPDNSKAHEDTIIILMDPDQLILRPFSDGNNWNETLWKDFSYDGVEPRTSVVHGGPMAQLYGFGLNWRSRYNLTVLVADEHEVSPILHLSDADFRRYNVGPPYLLTARDMWRVLNLWCAWIAPLLEQDSHFMAEMYAYSLAAAHLGLPHQVASSWMVSDLDAPDDEEGWILLRQMDPLESCRPPNPSQVIPNVLHYCQLYGLGPWNFWKWRLPYDFFSCHHELLWVPPHNVTAMFQDTILPDGAVYRSWTAWEAQQQAWVLCQLFSALNAAARYRKEQSCAPGTANLHDTFIMPNT